MKMRTSNGAATRVDAHLEFPCLLELQHVALTLEGAPSSQKDIFVVMIDVLRPSGKPRNGVVVNDLLPFAWHVGLRNWSVFANVNRDILGSNTILSRRLSMRLYGY